jgi:hypothetical protein
MLDDVQRDDGIDRPIRVIGSTRSQLALKKRKRESSASSRRSRSTYGSYGSTQMCTSGDRSVCGLIPGPTSRTVRAGSRCARSVSPASASGREIHRTGLLGRDVLDDASFIG